MSDGVATVITLALIYMVFWGLDKLDERARHLLSERTRWLLCGSLALAGIIWAILGATGSAWGFALLLTGPLFVMMLRRTRDTFSTGPRDGGTGVLWRAVSAIYSRLGRPASTLSGRARTTASPDDAGASSAPARTTECRPMR